MKRTKIIATYGPAIASVGKLKKLADIGVNLFRINCSHGDTPSFEKAVATIRKATKSARFPVGILFDISGPKLRLNQFKGEKAISEGDTVTLTTGATDLDSLTIGVNHPAIISSVNKGDRVFIDDGKIIFSVLKTGKKEVLLKTETDGVLLPGKGINLPDSDLPIETITNKDKKDIATAVRLNADYIALSFVRSGDDIINARKILKKQKGDQAIIAKLEKREAIEQIDSIMLLADGVMVARGDLGVELPFEELPKLQKKIIRMANVHHKPVIVATQMLESMRFEARATRAEINDVASAVFDYVDCVMLSAETATGKYPLEAVKAMNRVIESTEQALPKIETELEDHLIRSQTTHTIAKAVSQTYADNPTQLIFAFTSTGFTATLISNLFPPQPVIALSPDERVLSKLTLFRSVYPVKTRHSSSFDSMLKAINKINEKYKLVKKKQKVIITGGAPFGSNVRTNFMMIYKIGDTIGMKKR